MSWPIKSPGGEILVTPSGDTTGVSDQITLQTALNASASGSKIRVSSGNYYVTGLIMPSFGHLVLDAGTVIKLTGANLNLTGASWTSGSNTITVPSTAGLVSNMQLADLTNGTVPPASMTPFGQIPFGSRINTIVNATTFTIIGGTGGGLTTGASTGATLAAYINTNVITCQSVVGWSITCPNGWAKLDASSELSYYYDTNSTDGNRNALYANQVSDFLIDGIECANAFYHGFQCTGPNSGAKIIRFRGTNNGFRDIQLEGSNTFGGTATTLTSSPTVTGTGSLYLTQAAPGDNIFTSANVFIGVVLSVQSNTSLTLTANAAVTVTANAIVNTRAFTDNQLVALEASGGGWAAFRTRQGNEFNSGFFIIFADAVNTQIGSMRVKNTYGNGVALTGGIGAFLTNYPTSVSKRFQIANVITENCCHGIAFYNGIQKVHVASQISTGSQNYLPSGVDTVDAASTNVYYADTTGTMHSIPTRRINLPAGSIAAYGIKPAQRICLSNSATGAASDGCIVWSVAAGAGAGGKDQLVVFYVDETSDPYTTAATNTYAHIWGVQGFGRTFNTTPGAGQPIRDISFGNTDITRCSNGAISAPSFNTTGYDYIGIDFGHNVFEGPMLQSVNIGGMQNFAFDSWRQRDLGTYIPHVTASGSSDASLKNCASFEIRNFTHEHVNTSYTDNNIRLQLDANCRSGDIYTKSIFKPTGVVSIKVLTPSGASANGAGTTGPIILQNPLASDGTPLTVSGSMISRIDATACIVTRPVDAP